MHPLKLKFEKCGFGPWIIWVALDHDSWATVNPKAFNALGIKLHNQLHVTDTSLLTAELLNSRVKHIMSCSAPQEWWLDPLVLLGPVQQQLWYWVWSAAAVLQQPLTSPRRPDLCRPGSRGEVRSLPVHAIVKYQFSTLGKGKGFGERGTILPKNGTR